MEGRIYGLKCMIKKYFKGELVIENYNAGRYDLDLFIVGMGVGIIFDNDNNDKIHYLKDIMAKCYIDDMLQTGMSNECPLELYKIGYKNSIYIVDFNKTDVDIFVDLISMQSDYSDIENQIRHNDVDFMDKQIDIVKDIYIYDNYKCGINGFDLKEIKESFLFYINKKKKDLFNSHYLMSEDFWLKELQKYGIDINCKLEEII